MTSRRTTSLISFSGDVKISDFGIAKVAERQPAPAGGTVKGKLSYMSPEQITGQALDARSDIYSMGIVFWELITRHRLFLGPTSKDVVRRETASSHRRGNTIPTFPKKSKNRPRDAGRQSQRAHADRRRSGQGS